MSYDRLDWHADSAIEQGQPPENGFTHIGLYLAWLIRHDLHDREFFPAAHVTAVKNGEMTGSDLADDIDGKLFSDLMSDEGRAFSDARYGEYTAAYEATFEADAPYSVLDDEAAFARISPVIDGLYAGWVADGGPVATPATPQPGTSTDERPMPDQFSMRRMQDSTDRITAELRPIEPWPPRPHAAPDQEALIPAELTSPPPQISSLPASQWGSSLLRRALTRLGIRPADARVVNAMGGRGNETLVVMLYLVPAVEADRLVEEFRDVIALPTRGRWGSRVVANRTVQWASGDEFEVAFWARDGLVVHVAGRADLVEAAIPRLP